MARLAMSSVEVTLMGHRPAAEGRGRGFHALEEEQLMPPILQSLFSAEELMAMAGLMIPTATRTNRIGMLSAMRANAPAEAFGAILALTVQPNLSADDVAHLSEGLGLAA